MANETLLDSAYGLFNGALEGFVAKLIGAVVILLIGIVIGRILGRFVQKALHEVELNRLIKKTGVKFGLEELIGSFVSYIIYFISVIMALNTLGVTPIVLYVLLGAVLLLIILSALLATKDFIPNLVAGLFILKKSKVEKGAKIKAGNVEGTVVNMGLLETEIKTKKGDTIFIPNSTLTKEKLVVKKPSKK